MCGIFAYIGPRPPQDALIEGLKKLEYRGYDSSGMAFFKGTKIQSIKSLGEISFLEERLKKNSTHNKTNFLETSPNISLGMGHTRWATHGPPTEENAHPHQAGPVYVIHNGVIENEQSLRGMLSGVKFRSQTDSELIAHLINFHYQTQKSERGFLTAVLKAKDFLKGSYAVVTLCEKEANTLVAFKNGPPLMLCQGKEELFLSSDPHAVAGQVNRVMFLEDGDTLLLKNQKWNVFNQKGEKVKRAFSNLNIKESLSEKKGYPHFMLKEIFEQPQILRKMASSHIQNEQFYFSKNKVSPTNFKKLFSNTQEIIIVACGSSYHAGLYGQHIIENISGIKVSVEIASEFIYRNPVILPHTVLLFISQSGETADTLSALKWAKKKGVSTLSLCNVPNSTLDRLSDHSLFMNAGQEVGVASTKSFTASMINLNLLALRWAMLKNKLNKKEKKTLLENLLALPSYMEQVLGYDKFFLTKTEQLKKFKGFFYLGRGPYHSIALEGALKLKEIAYTHAEGYPAGEMKHGPLALIDENMVVVVLMPPFGSKLYEKTLINLKEAKSREAFIIAIGGEKETASLCHYHLTLPEIHSFFHPLLSVVPLQMMAYFISRSMGYNADKPRNLAKSVTVE